MMKNAMINAMLVVVSVTVTLLTTELGFRLVDYDYRHEMQRASKIGREQVKNPFSGVRYVYPAFSSYKQFWPSNPNQYFDPDSSLEYQINNYGFRDHDFSLARNNNLRIAFLGDSFCWGTGVRQEHIFTTLVEQELNTEKPLGQSYEVYNFCLPGFNSANEAGLYEHVVQHFQPDMLVVSFFLNDINIPPNLYAFWQWQSQVLAPPSWWRRHSRLLDFLWFRIDRRRAKKAFIENVNTAYEEDHPGRAQVAESFERIRRISAARNVPTLLVIFPWLVDLDRDAYPFSKAHQVTVQLGSAMKFQVLDLFPAFEGINDHDLWVHLTDHHPNQEGHRIAAQKIQEVVTGYLKQTGDALLALAEERRQTPIPPELEAPPTRAWYNSFAF